MSSASSRCKGTSSSRLLPLSNIAKVQPSDVICGRGGLAQQNHPGNRVFRSLVSSNSELYATSIITDKIKISRSIVAAIRKLNGRFIERSDGKPSASTLEGIDDYGNAITWRDIGDKRAVKKTSQALRENQPKILKTLAEKQGMDYTQAINGAWYKQQQEGQGSKQRPTVTSPSYKRQLSKKLQFTHVADAKVASSNKKAPPDGAQEGAHQMSIALQADEVANDTASKPSPISAKVHANATMEQRGPSPPLSNIDIMHPFEGGIRQSGNATTAQTSNPMSTIRSEDNLMKLLEEDHDTNNNNRLPPPIQELEFYMDAVGVDTPHATHDETGINSSADANVMPNVHTTTATGDVAHHNHHHQDANHQDAEMELLKELNDGNDDASIGTFDSPEPMYEDKEEEEDVTSSSPTSSPKASSKLVDATTLKNAFKNAPHEESALERAIKSPPVSPLTVGNAYSAEEGTVAISGTVTTTGNKAPEDGSTSSSATSSTNSEKRKATVRVALVDSNVSMEDVESIQFVCAKTNEVLGCRRLSI